MAELGASNQGLVTAAQLTAAGVTRSELSRATAAGVVVRVRSRVYATAQLPVLPRHLVTDRGVAPEYVAQVRAVLLGLGPTAAAAGRTAAALYGWGLLVEPQQIEVALPHGRHLRRKGVRASQRRSAARSRVRVLEGTGRLRLTAAAQTVIDCALDRPLVEAVTIGDSALRAGSATLEELQRAAARLPGVAGADRAREVVAMCDPLSGSVLESVLRVRLVRAGIDGFTTQAVLAVAPRQLRVDFCFPTAGLVVEADGARWHPDPARDQARDNALAVLGWRVLRLSWAQVVQDPDEALADIRAALTAAPVVHPGVGQALRAA